jgi:hypothetical protein
MAGMELLERLREGWRPPLDVLEHEQARELVTPVDIVRTDALGRQVVACPAGQTPPHWLQLTNAERDTLTEPPPPAPDGTLEAGAAGFTPRNVRVGFGIENPQ